MESRRLANKVVVVTGAANGIGAAIASRCAAEGASLVMVDRDQAGLERCSEQMRELTDGNVQASIVAGDITAEATIEEMIAVAVEQYGGSIVNVASMAAMRANRRLSLYGLTKGAVANLTMNAAAEFAKYNIRVNAICPGPLIPTCLVRWKPLSMSAAQTFPSHGLRRLFRLGVMDGRKRSLLWLRFCSVKMRGLLPVCVCR